MFCRNCGTPLNDDARFCPACGQATVAEPAAPATPPQPTQAQPMQPPYAPVYPQQPAPVYDSGSWGWFVLGLFIPLVGLILFLVWRNDKPLSSKRAGIGALVGVILSVVLTVVFYAFFFELIFSLAEDSSYYWPDMNYYGDQFYSHIRALFR